MAFDFQAAERARNEYEKILEDFRECAKAFEKDTTALDNIYNRIVAIKGKIVN